MWITYTDSTNTRIFTKGKYKNGDQVGKWIFNTPEGDPYKKLVYKGEKVKVVNYREDGSLMEKGSAKIVNESDKIHFYYYGKWTHYNQKGKVEKVSYYEKGHLVSSSNTRKGKSPEFDHLRNVLKQIEIDFNTRNRLVTETGMSSPDFPAVKAAKLRGDSLMFLKMDSIIAKYGYPSKEQVGDESGIIFFIISFSPWRVKEKYIETFRKAEEKKDISPKDLAYFEDKYLSAKSGYQVYGTQGQYDKHFKMNYYPVIDRSNMNERRKEKGLDPVDLSQYVEYVK